MNQKEFDIPVCRVGIGFTKITVQAKNRKEAEIKALDEAGDHDYSEKDAEYEVVDGIKKKEKNNFKVKIKWNPTEPWNQSRSFATEAEAEAFILGISLCFTAVGDGDYDIKINWKRK